MAHIVAERAHIPILIGVATDDPQAVHRVEGLFHDLIAKAKVEDWRITGDRNSVERVAKLALEATEGGKNQVLSGPWFSSHGMNKTRQQRVARQTPGAVVVEAVDLSDFIDFADTFVFKSTNARSQLIDFAATIMTGVSASDLKSRLSKVESGRARTDPSEMELAAIAFGEDPAPRTANRFLVEINKLSGVRPHRPAILSACLRALDSCSDAEEFHEISVSVREQQRVVGREIKGRAVGCTLLLKGLEADVVVLLDTDEFGPNDLYVALTRGARKIVVCSCSSVITFT
ncbi:ATP-binding domain-containing protein [Lutimaribacter sp. EGI FJ00015]|nr:ATP-binding domain-containing protein [Lutimaribacter sp. EGI FJ00015]MCO0637014.1 ATP-binding domain-containing protein [Lutimaribacter sp. EGI FJ00014]